MVGFHDKAIIWTFREMCAGCVSNWERGVGRKGRFINNVWLPCVTPRNCRGLSRWCSVSKRQAKCWKRIWWGIIWTFLVEKDLRGVVGGYVLKWAWCSVMAKNQLAAIRTLLRKRAGIWVQMVVFRILWKPIVYSVWMFCVLLVSSSCLWS